MVSIMYVYMYAHVTFNENLMSKHNDLLFLFNNNFEINIRVYNFLIKLFLYI